MRDYVTYYLKGLQEVARTVVLIANGGVNAAGLEKLERIGVEVLQRENHGLDFAAWKAALLQRGWDNVQTYDELILCNCSCYGPVYPFSEAFERMSQKKCDFWGMTRHPDASPSTLIAGESDTRIVEHLQSYFLVFRHSVIESESFHSWWHKLVPADSFIQEVAYHEIKLTPYLVNNGFSYDTLMNSKMMNTYLPKLNPTIYASDKLLLEDRVPIFKRKLLSAYTLSMNPFCSGKCVSKVMEGVYSKTEYPISYIWEDVLATQSLSQICTSLHSNYVLPAGNGAMQDDDKRDLSKVAIVCSVQHGGLVEYVLSYIKTLPDCVAKYIISSDKETLTRYKTDLEKNNIKNVKQLHTNCKCEGYWGLFLHLDEVVRSYQYICYIHDFELRQTTSIDKKEYLDHCGSCTLYNTAFVSQIIKLFDNNPFLGLLLPPPINYGPYQSLCADKDVYLQEVEKLREQVGLSVPVENVYVNPNSNILWIRSKALVGCYDDGELYNKLKHLSQDSDSSTTRAIGAVTSIMMQRALYYSGWVSPDAYAGTYMSNLIYMHREYNNRLYKLYGKSSWRVMLKKLDSAIERETKVHDVNMQKTSSQDEKKVDNEVRIQLRSNKKHSMKKNNMKDIYWKLHYKICNPKFFPAGYMTLYPDVKASTMSAWEHYVKFGKTEGRCTGYPTANQFDAEMYLEQNPDVAAACMDPWEHFAQFGIHEGRAWPKRKNPEVRPSSPNEKPDVKSKLPHHQPNPQEGPCFSIIMPTYNRAYMMTASIDAVLHQNYKNYELLIADDGSTDDTEKLITSKYAREIERGFIRYIKCAHHGVCITRNTALKNAKYAWIAYVDTDNYVTEDWLEIYAKAIKENPQYTCFYSKFEVIQNGKVVGRKFSYELLKQGNYIDLGVFVHHISDYRKNGGFDEKLERLVDWDLILRYTYQNKPYFIDAVTLKYNDDSDRTDRISVSKNREKAMEQVKRKHRTKSVTTCITTYNQEKYIAQAIESALMQQGHINHKIIIYDDCSTDGTSEIASQYAKKHPKKITHIRNKVNLGLNLNLKQVFKNVETDYLAILEGDDCWIDIMRLDKLTTYLDCNLDCSMCFNALLIYNEGNLRFRSLKRQAKLPEKLDGSHLIFGGPIVNLSCCVYRKEVATSIPDVIINGKMSEIAVAMHALKFGSVAFYNEKLSIYRQHVSGVWTGLSKVQNMQYRIQARETIGAVCPPEYRDFNNAILKDYRKQLIELQNAAEINEESKSINIQK